MPFAWLLLLPALSYSRAAAPIELEAPDRRSYAEATPEMLARRAKSCRADLAAYRSGPDLELMGRLIVCLEHPDAKLRAEVLDLLPDRRLWDRPDFDSSVRPAFQEVLQRFQKDPDWQVQLHAGQLQGWLSNARQWRDWDSPEAQARRRAESSRQSRPRLDGQSQRLQDRILMIVVLAVLLVGLAGKRFVRR